MDRLTARNLLEFEVLDRADVYDAQVEIVRGGETMDVWPEACAGLASLSGALDDASDLESLIEAVRHGVTLLHIGVVTDAQAYAAAWDVVTEFMANVEERMAPR